MAAKSIRVTCPFCRHDVYVSAKSNECNCGARFRVSVQKPGAGTSRSRFKKQDATYVPKGVKSFAKSFLFTILGLVIVITIILSNPH